MFREQMAALRRGEILWLILLPLTFATFAAWSTISPSVPNVMTRVGLTHAIVAHGSLSIDEIARLERDRAFFQGHYYCDKAPGVSLICTPPVWVVNTLFDLAGQGDALVTPDNRRTPRYFASAFACLFGALIPLSAAAVLLFYLTVRRAGAADGVARAASVAFAFGTPFLLWSTVVFGHATAAALLLIGFAPYFWTGGSARRDAGLLVGAGFALALAITVEFLTGPPAAAIGLMLAIRDRSWAGFARRAAWLAAGGWLPLAALLFYNWQAFGSPFHLGYGAVDGWEGMRQGLFGVAVPDPVVLAELIAGPYRGILWLSPVLAAAFYGCVTLLRSRAYCPIGLLALGTTAYYFLVNAGYFYWDGGWSTGPRHVTPCVPFLMLGLALAYGSFTPPVRRATVVAGAYSLVVVPLCALINVRAPNDGQPMLAGHILPDLMAGESSMALVHFGAPFVLAFAPPMIGLAAFLWWVATRVSRSGDGRHV